jgi:hypothetical protein
MRSTLIRVATGFALASAASFAIAQQAPREKVQGPAAQDKAPESKGQGGPGLQQQPRAKDAPKGMDQPRATERPDKDRPKATEGPGKDRPKATERPDKDRPKATEGQSKDRPKATQQPDKDRPKATEAPDKAQPKATERPLKGGPKATEGPDKDRPKAVEKKSDRIQLSDQQRSKVTERLRQVRVERARIGVDVHVGARIPRSVRLYTPPAAIIEIAPVYRGYRYVVLENDTIVIVDPQTYVVVDVIAAGPRQAERSGRAQLTLSAEEMRFIFMNVPKARTANVRLRLALGAEVPRGVDLLAFPSSVVERVPELAEYRYIVAENDIAIVDPADHAIVLVISE